MRGNFFNSLVSTAPRRVRSANLMGKGPGKEGRGGGWGWGRSCTAQLRGGKKTKKHLSKLACDHGSLCRIEYRVQ